MTERERAWAVRAEILAHDFSEREKDLLEVLLLCSYDVGLVESSVTNGFGSFTGRREDEERRILAALAKAGVIVWDGRMARILPDPARWKIRRKVVATAPVVAPRQTEFIEDRPLDAALASVSRDHAETTLVRRLAERDSMLLPAPGSTPPAPGGHAKTHDPPCEPANSQPRLAELSLALGCAQAKAKAKLSSELSSEALALELRRRIGDQAWQRYPQWQRLVESTPDYMAGILRYAIAAEAETGKPIRSMGGYLSRIARDDGKWPEIEPLQTHKP